jgi:hypothetical protein
MWAWPIAQRTTWWVSALCSIRIVTSSATSRCSAEASLSSSALLLAWMATGSSGSGSTHGSTSAGLSLRERVSEVSALDSLATRTMSPAMANSLGASRRPAVRTAARPARRRRARVALEFVAEEALEVPGDVDDLFGAQRAGEDPHQREAADIRVAAGADDLGDQRAGRVARDGQEVAPSGVSRPAAAVRWEPGRRSR